MVRAAANYGDLREHNRIHAPARLRSFSGIPVLSDLRLNCLLGGRRLPELNRRGSGVVRRFRWRTRNVISNSARRRASIWERIAGARPNPSTNWKLKRCHDDPLEDFTRRDVTFDGIGKAVYVAGAGPAVIVMSEMPGISPHVARFA